MKIIYEVERENFACTRQSESRTSLGAIKKLGAPKEKMWIRRDKESAAGETISHRQAFVARRTADRVWDGLDITDFVNSGEKIRLGDAFEVSINSREKVYKSWEKARARIVKYLETGR
jgi:hypothetical protein